MIRQMDQSRDWPAVGDALDEAFRDHWGELKPTPDEAEAPADEPMEEIAKEEEDDEDDPYFNSRAFCFVAWDGNQVAGSCLGNERAIEWLDSGKIGSLSVRRPYRRLGIGRALTLHALGRFYDHGIRRIITDTDADGFTGAYRLYQQAGMHIYRREVTYEKELRPGNELRLLSPTILRKNPRDP
jgi:ribosomal protein S18 acetylase RimI-like enzyme